MSSQQGKPGGDTYFSEFRKGEVNELMTLLRSALSQKDGVVIKGAIQKVIAYMTLGIDMSRLFKDMIMATNTTDLVQKKLVYMYLCNYAVANPEISLLVVNTLITDCKDHSPMVRGLALRSLCSLRLPQLVEYLLPQIQNGLLDTNAYVRKTAVLGCLKLFHISRKVVTDSQIIDKLYDMLRDKDAQVVANVVNALNEILVDEGGMALNRSIVVHLLNKLMYVNEWAQCSILELVSRYRPPRKEIFDYLNLLEGRMSHSNGAVVFAAIKCFLFLTQDYVDLYTKVLSRVRTPLLTVLSTSSNEMRFTALKHISLLIHRAPTVFSEDYKHFFCGFNEPSYLKEVKVEILEKIASVGNMNEIVSELSEYVRDIDIKLARKSVNSIAKIAVRLPGVSEHSLERLISFLEFGVDIITANALLVMKDVLRRYPQHAKKVVPDLSSWMSRMELPESKAAVVWMLGEYGEQVAESPYLLEAEVDKWGEQDPLVKIQLLRSCTALFFKTPGEMQPILGKMFQSATLDSNVDVHDRAYFIYRAFKKGPDVARTLLDAPKAPLTGFAEDNIYQVVDQLFKEFGTLSVIYDMPEEQWTGVALPDEDKVESSSSSEDSSSSSSTSTSSEDGTNSETSSSSSGSGSSSSGSSSSGESSSEDDGEESEEDAAPPPQSTGTLISF